MVFDFRNSIIVARYLSVLTLVGSVVLSVGFSSVFISCAAITSQSSEQDTAQKHGDEPALPFSLEVTEERYDGKNLYLSLKLTSLTSHDPRSSLLRVTPFEQGKRLSSHSYAISDIKRASEVAHSKVLSFPLVVRVGKMTDYQLELVWGQEARTFAKSSGSDRSLRTISEVAGLHISAVEYDRSSGLKAILEYAGDSTLEGLILQFAMVENSEPLDFQTAFNQNGEEFILEALVIEPHTPKKLKIIIEGEGGEDKVEELDQRIPMLRALPLKTNAIPSVESF